MKYGPGSLQLLLGLTDSFRSQIQLKNPLLVNFHHQRERANGKGFIDLLEGKGLDVSMLRILGEDSMSVNTGRFMGLLPRWSNF
jgi:hypothetical protein